MVAGHCGGLTLLVQRPVAMEPKLGTGSATTHPHFMGEQHVLERKLKSQFVTPILVQVGLQCIKYLSWKMKMK